MTVFMTVFMTAFSKTIAVPLQQPFAGPPAFAAQQFNPETSRADAHITVRRRAGLGRDTPPGQRRADAQIRALARALTLPSGQQQGGDARGFRRQLQTPALPQIQTPHLAYHHGQAGAFQGLFHGP